jgi:CRP-like cAMP-binding protein
VAGDQRAAQKLAKGSVVIQNGVRSENLYIVIDGRLAVVLPNGFKLAEVGVGEILGEISLVISSPRPHRWWWKRIAWCSLYRN